MPFLAPIEFTPGNAPDVLPGAGQDTQDPGGNLPTLPDPIPIVNPELLNCQTLVEGEVADVAVETFIFRATSFSPFALIAGPDSCPGYGLKYSDVWETFPNSRWYFAVARERQDRLHMWLINSEGHLLHWTDLMGSPVLPTYFPDNQVNWTIYNQRDFLYLPGIPFLMTDVIWVRGLNVPASGQFPRIHFRSDTGDALNLLPFSNNHPTHMVVTSKEWKIPHLDTFTP